MKENVGRQNLKYQDLNGIEKYCMYANVVKQNFIDYLELVTPLFVDNLDKKGRDQLYHTITAIFFGDEVQENKTKQIKSILPQMEQALRNIKTLGAEELQGHRAEATLKKINS